MSSIDDRIVEMQFNNASFEKNIDDSIKSLKNLNDALDLKDASNGLDNVMVAVKAIDLGTIVDGVQNISDKFNVLGGIGLSVINTLTKALMGFAGNSVNAILDPLIEGGKRRAQNIEQAKFMISGLGKSWEALYKDMDYAVSGTAYGIDQAAKAASQLSASSINAGRDMKMSLRGISGVAAMTSSSYDDIAQIFTTVAGNGRLMASELNRISARGLNAAQALADFYNEGRKGAKLTERDIRDMVSKGKVSFKDFARAMDGAFGAQATKANETYSGSLSNVKAALSRIGEKFATPVYEKQRNIFNQLRLVINAVSQALSPFIKLWGEVQKLSGDAMVGFLKDVEKAVGILSNSPNTAYAKEIEAYRKYQADKKKLRKGETLYFSEEAKAGKQRLKEQDKLQKAELAAQKKYDAAKKKYEASGKKGKKPKKPKILVDRDARKKAGTTQERTPFVQSVEAVTDGLRTLQSISNAVFKTMQGAFNEVFPKDPAAADVLLTIANAFKELMVWLYPSNQQLSSFRKVLIGFFTAVKIVGAVVGGIFQTIPTIIKVAVGVFKLLGAVVRPVTDFIEQMATSFLKAFNVTGNGIDVVKLINDAFTSLRENGIGKLLDILDTATKAVTDFWNNLGSGSGENLFAGFDPFNGMLETLKGFGATMAGFFSSAWEWAKGIKQSISDAMGKFGGGAGGFFSAFGDTLRNIGTAISQTFKELKEGFTQFFKGFDWATLLAGLSSGAFIAIIAKSFKFMRNLFTVTDEITDFVKKLKSGVTDAIGQFTDTMKTMQNEIKTKMIVNIALAVGILAAAFWILSKVDLEGADTAAAAMTIILIEVMGALYLMTKMNTDKGILKMTGLATALVILSVALIVIANAAKILSSIDPERLGKAMMSLGFGLMMLIGALGYLNEMDPKKIILGAIAMNILANALIVMAAAIGILGLMPVDVLVQGGIAVAALIALLTIFAAFPGDKILQAGIAVGVMAGSIMILVGAIAILGVMDLGTLAQGFISVGFALAALVLAANMLKGTEGSAAAMLAMAAALVLLIIPIKMFSEMDSEALAQGIGSTIVLLIGLVVAANAMEKAVPGAAAMIAMAVAIAILAAAVWVMAQIPGDQLLNVFLMIAGGLGVLIGAAALAQMVAPGLFILAGAILAIGLAVALAGAGVIMMAIGMATLGVALQSSIPGMMAFAAACVQMLPQMLAMVALAVALAALAVAVGALGVAFILLGTGLVLIGAGMAMLAAFGGIGAIAVLAIWKALEPLIWQVVQIGALGAAFGVLGAGLLLLGGGLALTAVATVAMAIGMLALVGAGFAFAATIDSVRMSLERFIPVAPQLTGISTTINDFGFAFRNANIELTGIVTTLDTAATGLSNFATSADESSKKITDLPTIISDAAARSKSSFATLVSVFTSSAVSLGQATTGLGTQIQNGTKNIDTAFGGVLTKVRTFASDLSGQSTVINTAANTMLGTLGTTISTKLKEIQTTLKGQAKTAGGYITDGLRNGINDGTGTVVTAARAMATRVINAIKDEFKIKSPSKVMEELGKYVTEGFYKGLTGFEDAPVHRVLEAVSNMKEELKKAIDEANADIKSAGDKVNKLSKKKKKSKKDKKDLADAKKELAAAKDVKKNSEEAMKLLEGALKAQQNQLMKVSDQYDIVVEKVKNAATDLENAKKEMADAAKSYTDQFNKLPEFGEEGDVVGTYVADIQKQIDATMKFAESLAYLRNMGLDNTTYKKLLEKGTDAQPFIDALIASGQAGVDQINKLDSELEDVASALGTTAAKEMYQNGVDMARGLLEGLQAQEAKLKAEMESLGKAIVDAIKKQLGIKSPSRVFAEVGGYSMIGLMEGMQKYIPALERTASDAGDSAVDGLRKAINDIGASVYGEMDMSPVIRPVLDLTDVENSAKQLGTVFSSKSINVGSVYANASDIALASRARELLTEQMREDALSQGDSVTFIQNNTSPKAISNIDLYRQTRNQLSDIKKGLPK